MSEDRYQGFLTTKDREFLRGEMDPEKSDTRQQRYQLRERTKQAISDLALIQKQLGERDKIQIAEHHRNSPDAGAFVEMMSFLYDINQYLTHPDDDELVTFERLLRQALVARERGEGTYVEEVEAKIVTSDPEAEEIRERILDGNGTRGDLHYLQQHGEFRPLLEDIIESEELVIIEPEDEWGTPTEITPLQAERIIDSLEDSSQSN